MTDKELLCETPSSYFFEVSGLIKLAVREYDINSIIVLLCILIKINSYMSGLP